MNEAGYQDILCKKLKKRLEPLGMMVDKKVSLCYNLHLSLDGSILPDITNLARGYDAFENDIVIYKEEKGKKVPYVVIELKYDSVTTHDAITYSCKAKLLKNVYPYVRYLFVIAFDAIPSRVLNHGESFDAIIALNPSNSKFSKKQWNDFVTIIKEEIKAAEKISHLLKARKDIATVYRKKLLIIK